MLLARRTGALFAACLAVSCGGSTLARPGDAGPMEAAINDDASHSPNGIDAAAPDGDDGGDGGDGGDVGADAAPAPMPTPCPNDPPCDAGMCPFVPLGNAAGSGFTTAIAVGGSRVYWVNNGSSAVYAPTGSVGYLDRCGAGGATIAAQQKDPYNVTADENGPCWTNLGETIGGRYQMDGETVCWDGTSVNVVASGQNGPWGVGVGGTMVFWANSGEGTANAQVFSTSRSGGSADALFSATYGGNLSVAVDVQSVYVTGDNEVLAIDRASGAPRVLAQGQLGVSILAEDATTLYVQGANSQGTGSPLVSVPKVGGNFTVLSTDCIGTQIAADGRYVYCIGVGGVERVPVGGGAPETISSSGGSSVLAADGIYVYVADGNTIGRVRSP